MASQMQAVNISTNENGALYARSYGASISVMKGVVPFMDECEAERLKSSVTAVPRLIAAGLMDSLPGERREKLLCDAALGCREAVVMLSYCRDLRSQFVSSALCASLIDAYGRLGEEIDRIIRARGTNGGER